MLEAAKFGDPVLGVDIHMVLVPAPPAPAPIPTPLPHPFVGVVFDPLGAAIGAALGLAFGGGGPVLINYMPCGNTGTEVKGVPHFPTPPGVSFAPNDIPSNDGTLIFGSKTVTMAGSSIARLTDLVMTCNFPINLPTSVCMAVPMGAPVLVGGPPSMDWFAAITKAIRTRWFSDMLHKVTGGRFSKVICFLTGHPVDVMTGEVLTDRADFELPGPLPLTFERDYCSRSTYDGPLGPGWSHSLDQSVHEEDWRLVVRLADGRERHHPRIPEGVSLWDDADRYTLERTAWGYTLTTSEGLTCAFTRVEGARATHPLVRVSDRSGNAIRLRYERGALREVTDSAGRTLRFDHRADGRLARACVERPTERGAWWMELVRYEYDDTGALAAAFDAGGDPYRYAYRGGVLVRETDRNGMSFYFEYDREHPEGWCTRTWGDGGAFDRRITYDKHRHVTLVDDSRGGRTHYFGNAAGLVTQKIDPTGGAWKYEWDARYRKVAEEDPIGHRTEWGYDARGNRELERDALGHETRWRYDARGSLVGVTDAAGHAWELGYDDRGRLTRRTDPLGRSCEYDHDARGQRVGVIDPLGRRARFGYNDRGDLTEARDADGADQLRSVTRADGAVVRFAYDALGRRVRKSVGAAATEYVWDGDALVHEVSGGAVTSWVFDPEEGVPLAKVTGAKRYGVFVDHLGTPAALVDEVGALAWSAQLDIYGVARADVARTGCPWRWPGQFEDEETGLYYNRFRYYDPEAGGYISPDPIGLRGGANLHAYPHDPLTRADPLGLVSPFDVMFSQDSVSHDFQHGPWKNRCLDEAVAEARRLGRLPDGLELRVMRLNDEWVTLSNRTLLVAQEAGLRNVPVTDVGHRGINQLNTLLDGRPPQWEQPTVGACKK
jgi:RHS repeat-associated protein